MHANINLAGLLLSLGIMQSFELPIWRCPEFKLLPSCKILPSDCSSYRMIYVRHIHMACPACLICAESKRITHWSMFKTHDTKLHRLKRRRRKKSKDKNLDSKVKKNQRRLVIGKPSEVLDTKLRKDYKKIYLLENKIDKTYKAGRNKLHVDAD